MNVDPLQTILRSMRIECAVTARLEATAPWAVRFCNAAPRFGFVVRGACWIELEGEAAPRPLAAGDGFVLTRGRAFVLRDAPGSRVQRCQDLMRGREGETIPVGSGGGARTDVVFGTLAFDAAASRPLLEVLPELLHLRADEEEGGILRGTLELLAAETAKDRLGRSLVCARLGEILFIQAVRRFAATRGEAGVCWLSALADPLVGTALRAMHADLQRPWTVAALARAAGSSRSAFALRFKALVGETPLAHLARWRMHSASCHLRNGTLGLGEIAEQVGYESEAAFARAFKRIVGRAPGAVRKGAPTAPPGPRPRRAATARA